MAQAPDSVVTFRQRRANLQQKAGTGSASRGRLSFETQTFIDEWTRMRDIHTRQSTLHELPLLELCPKNLPSDVVLPEPALRYLYGFDLFAQPVTRVLSEYHHSPPSPQPDDDCCEQTGAPVPLCLCPPWARRLFHCVATLPTSLLAGGVRTHPSCRLCRMMACLNTDDS